MKKIFSGFSGFFRISDEGKLKDAGRLRSMGWTVCDGGGLDGFGHGGFWCGGWILTAFLDYAG